MMKIIDEIEVLVRRVDVERYENEEGRKKTKDIVGEEIEPGEDGFLGEAVIARGDDGPEDRNFPDKFLLEVSYPRTAQVFCCTSQGMNLSLCSDRNKERDFRAEERSGATKPIYVPKGDHAVHTLKVPRRYHRAYTPQAIEDQLFSQEPPDGEFYTASRYPANSIKAFVLKGERLVLYEVGIISQFGRFYLTTQKTFEAVVGLVDGKLFIQKEYGPRHDTNKDLRNLLVQFNEDEASPLILKAFESEPCPVLRAPLTVEKGDGVVEWFNDASGMCAIRLADGRVGGGMWSHVEDSPFSPFSGKRVGLRPGQHVLIKHFIQPDRDRKTEFALFLRGIKAIG